MTLCGIVSKNGGTMKKFEITYLYGTWVDRYSGSESAAAEHPSEEEAARLCAAGWEPVAVLPEWGYNAPALVFKREVVAVPPAPPPVREGEPGQKRS